MKTEWYLTDKGVRNKHGYICLFVKPSHYTGQDERYKTEMKELDKNIELILGGLNKKA